VAFTVADYVAKRLNERVDTLFGVPAAYCSELFDAALARGMRSVVAASDLEAGYSADGYARTKGLGAVSVSYGVGTLSMINAIAGAYVERSPVVVINGGPTSGDLANLSQFDIAFSHSIGQAATDLNAYKLVTASAARAATAAAVPAVVDNAILTALTKQRPVYVEINKSEWMKPCPQPGAPLAPTFTPTGHEAALAVTIVGLIRAAQSPVILIGEEIQRYGLAAKAAAFITNLGVRWASSLLAKSTLAEQGKGWIGVYDPPHSMPAIKTAVEGADLLVTLGCVYPNGYSVLFSNGAGKVVQIHDGKVRVKGATMQNAEINALMTALVTEAGKKPPKTPPNGAIPVAPPAPTGALTYKQVIERIGVALDNTLLAIPDTLLGVYASANLPVQGQDGFLISGVWASIGHSVAAAVGAAFGSTRRPLVICGDGGFHMTASALSTMVQAKCNPIIVVIDNGIYGYEQFLIEPGYFNNPGATPKPYVALNRWDFVKFANGLGIASAQTVNTGAALDAALAAAKTSNAPALIAAQVDPHNLPANLP
jgi:indolepyruvate decarboxylase